MNPEGIPSSCLQIKGLSETCCDLPSPLPCQSPPLIQGLLQRGLLPQSIPLPLYSIQTHEFWVHGPRLWPCGYPATASPGSTGEGSPAHVCMNTGKTRCAEATRKPGKRWGQSGEKFQPIKYEHRSSHPPVTWVVPYTVHLMMLSKPSLLSHCRQE